jgi:hypothetical protein
MNHIIINYANAKYQPVVNNTIKVNISEPIIYYPWKEVLFVKGVPAKKHEWFLKKYGDHYSTKTPKNIQGCATKWIEHNSDSKLVRDMALFLEGTKRVNQLCHLK